MVLGLFDQLLIFSQLYLIELLRLLTGLGLLEVWHLIYPKLLIGFGIPHKKLSRDLTEKKQDLTKMSIILMVLTEI